MRRPSRWCCLAVISSCAASGVVGSDDRLEPPLSQVRQVLLSLVSVSVSAVLLQRWCLVQLQIWNQSSDSNV